LADRRLQRL